MKRRDMLYKIADSLGLIMTSPSMNVEDGAELILSIIEEAGMRAPFPGGDLAGIIEDGDWEHSDDRDYDWKSTNVIIPEDYDPQF